MKRLTIIIPTHITYIDIALIADKLFCKYWKDCPYDVVVSTNELHDYPFKVFKIFSNSASDEFIRRIYNASHAYDTKFYLIINEDRFLNNTIAVNEIEDIMTYMTNEGIDFCRFIPSNCLHKKIKLKKIKKCEPYGMNMAGCICTKQFIDRNLIENINGWVYENSKLEETLNFNKDAEFENAIKSNIDFLHTVHGIQKNEWIPKSYKKLKKANPEIDFDIRPLAKCTFSLFLKNFLSYPLKYLNPKTRFFLKMILRKFGLTFTTNN